jgi:hypothetical protein
MDPIANIGLHIIFAQGIIFALDTDTTKLICIDSVRTQQYSQP